MTRVIIFALLLACSTSAAEHRGQVQFGGLPVPGVTVTATQGNKRHVTITAPDGTYSFANLADGEWTVRVEMLCFAPEERKLSAAAPAEWELKPLPLDKIQATAAAPLPAQ